MRHRLVVSCLALSLILPAAFLSLGSSGVSAGVPAGVALPETVTPLIVEVKKGKGNWGGNKYKGKNWNKYSGKNWNKYGGNKYYVKRWNRRPHYGAVVAGVTLGTILGVAAAGAAPAPRDNLCWYWTDASRRSGYWDYCY